VKELKAQEIPYQLIRKVSASGLQSRAVKLENGARVCFLQDAQDTVSLVHIPEDSTEEEKKIYKIMAMSQLGLILFVLFVAFLIEPFLIHQKEEVVVTIPPEIVREMVKPRPTVKAAAKPVVKKNYAHKKVKSPLKRKTRKTLTAKNHAPKRVNAPARAKKVQVEKVGALGAFGGMHSGSKNSAGFNVSAKNDSAGSSWTQVGSGGRGGMERAIHGKGLAAGTPGNGGNIVGGGGYGTQGTGGGRVGYGHVGAGGTAASYFQPLEEEALIEGGLDRDQIAAVINKHIGQIIYCYERGLQKSPGLSGRVGVDFTINGGGRVARAAVGSSSLRSAAVEGCIVNRLKSWPFPKPVGGVNVKVSYPFVLKRVGHG
jgi:outer membrane biosynthesis protein TonB